MTRKQHVLHTEQNSEAGLQENMERNYSCVSQDFQHLLRRVRIVQIEGVEFQTITAVRIYARYVPVIFLALFMSSSISVDISRL